MKSVVQRFFMSRYAVGCKQQARGRNKKTLNPKKRVFLLNGGKMKNEIEIEIWFEENEEAIIEKYYESGACYDCSLEWFFENEYEKELERRSV